MFLFEVHNKFNKHQICKLRNEWKISSLTQTIEKPHFRFFTLSQRKILSIHVLEFPADCVIVSRGKSSGIGHRVSISSRKNRRAIGELNFQISRMSEWNEFSSPDRERGWEKRRKETRMEIDNGFRCAVGRHERAHRVSSRVEYDRAHVSPSPCHV